MTARVRSEDQLRQPNRARKLARFAERQQRKADVAQQQADDATRELNELWESERQRLGVDLPRDPAVLDVVALIDVEEGDVWRWHGLRNNKGLPVAKFNPNRTNQHELSVTRLLAIALGVIGEDERVSLYPMGDTDDVNPTHRSIRRGARLGNPDRFTRNERKGQVAADA